MQRTRLEIANLLKKSERRVRHSCARYRRSAGV